MGVVQIVAFAVLVIWLAYKEKESFLDVLPIAVCLLTLVLYSLSFVNGLMWSDYLALAVCIAAIVSLVNLSKKKKNNEFWSFLKEEMMKPGTLVALFLLILVPLLTSEKTVTWWDDYNFWATDAKSLYYLNGFAEKYQNVAPEFGDYPPGTQMIKWWFMHLNPTELREGLMFSGYTFMNLCFLCPLLKALKKRSLFLMPVSAVALWMFPTCVEVFGIDGFCADLTMAIIYGAFLVAVVEQEGHSDLFYYGRQALFLTVMILCKNTGFIWVAFGLLFSYGYHFFCHKRSRKGILCVTLLPVLAEVSWLMFCLFNRRVAKLTGAAVQMATGNMNVPEVKEEMVEAFITAFIRYPLHRWSTFAIDLSPLALYLLLLLFVFILYKRNILKKWQGWYIGGFLGISGAVFYAINLLSHLTIFAVETQYLEPFGMVSSIERYGAPFTIGGLYLLAYFATKTEKCSLNMNRGILICLLFVFLTADYESAYRGLIGYRATTSEVLRERDEIVDAKAEQFLEKAGAGQSGSGKRVLYLRDSSDVSWIRNTYIGFEAAPVSVMYGNIDGKSVGTADIIRAVEEAHAGYLYADEITDGKKVFDELTSGEEFEYGCLYQIGTDNGQLRLYKVNG